MVMAVINTPGGTMEITENSYVENVIIIEAGQAEEMEEALGKPLLEAAPLGLEMGDLYNGQHWTRNVNGEQVALPIPEAANPDLDEALAILRGEKE